MTHRHILGNFLQLIDYRTGFDFMESLQPYGGVTVLSGTCKVCIAKHIIYRVLELINFATQQKLVYVTDPTALYHIFIKDVSKYKVPVFIMEYAELRVGAVCTCLYCCRAGL